MTTEPREYASMDEALTVDRPMLEKNLRTLERVGVLIDGWDSKLDARQTGYSLHVKFGKPTSVGVAIEHAELMQRCPAMLADALRRLLACANEVDRNDTQGSP